MTVFSSISYKVALRNAVLARKDMFGPTSVDFQSLAKAAKVQKTYLSRVLNGEGAHLSSDQLFRAIEFLGFTEVESDFVQLLHEFERSDVPSRRKKLEIKIRAIRERENKTENHISPKKVTVQVGPQADYYTDLNLQIVHMFLTIKKFADNPDQLQAALGFNAQQVERILSKLLEIGIIEFQGRRIKVTADHLHLPNSSSLNRAYQMISRMKLIEGIHNAKHKDDYHFNVVISTDEKTRLEIQSLFYEFLKQVESKVRNCEPEDVYQMAFDIVRWS